MRNLVRQHDSVNEGSLQLWTWLPSYHFAKKAHGDYVDEVQPSPEDLMIEACKVFAYLSRNEEEVSPQMAEHWPMCEGSDAPTPEELQEFLSGFKPT